MKKIMSLSTLAVIIALITACGVLFGCRNVSDGGDETEADGSAETSAEVTDVTPGEDVSDNDVFELSSTKAKMKLKLENDKLYVVSLTSESGREYIGDEPAELSMPDVNVDVKFKSAETYLGERRDSGFKFTFEGADTRLELFVSVQPRFAGPFEFWGYIYNESSSSVDYSPGRYFGLKVQFEDLPIAYTFNKESGIAEGWTIYSGQRFDGPGIHQTELYPNKTASAIYNTNQDWNAGGYISMMYINQDDDSHGLYLAQEWSSGRVEAKCLDDDSANYNISLSSLIGDARFLTTLPAGGSMYLPSIYVGVYDGDMDDGSNDYKRWFLNCKAPTNMIENENEPLTQQDMQIGANVSPYGIQSIKWDYGWWTNEKSGNWKKYEGLLEVGSTSYLNSLGKNAGKQRTLAEFTDKIRKTDVNGQPLSLTTYVLLKDTGLDREGVPTSVGANGHPEWFSDRIVTVCPSADLGNEDCVKFYQKYLYDFFKPTSEGGMGVTTWRSDFEPICRTSNKENRHAANGSDVQYWCTVGFGEVVDYLIDNIDGFRYESCSSGGSMKDLFTMTKASVINCDDSADYMSLHMSFYDSSYAIHPAQLQLPINSLSYLKGSANYSGTAQDYMYGLRCQMTGGVMLSNWNGTNSGWGNSVETNAWKNAIAKDYNKKIKPLIREGDLYHVLPRPDGIHWDAIEYADADSANDIKAVLMVWKPSDEEGNSKTIKLRGLDPDATYSLDFTDHRKLECELTGKELMETGLTLVFDEEVTSDVIYFELKK